MTEADRISSLDMEDRKCEESRMTAKFWAWGTRQNVFPLSKIGERGEGRKIGVQ